MCLHVHKRTLGGASLTPIGPVGTLPKCVQNSSTSRPCYEQHGGGRKEHGRGGDTNRSRRRGGRERWEGGRGRERREGEEGERKTLTQAHTRQNLGPLREEESKRTIGLMTRNSALGVPSHSVESNRLSRWYKRGKGTIMPSKTELNFVPTPPPQSHIVNSMTSIMANTLCTTTKSNSWNVTMAIFKICSYSTMMDRVISISN